MTDTAEKKDVVPSQYREKYKATGGTNGDFIAVALSKVGEDGLAALGTVKTENGIDAKRWEGFNPGMQRMNLANVLRGMYLKGETIKILGKAFNAKHQAQDMNGTLANSPASLGKLAKHLDLQDNERMIAALGKLFFPPEPKGPTAEQRAATKAAKEAEKLAAKAKRDTDAAEKKAKREADAAAKKAEREQTSAAKKAEREAAAEAKRVEKAAQQKAADEAKLKVEREAAALKAADAK